jgi:hypothetical protein
MEKKPKFLRTKTSLNTEFKCPAQFGIGKGYRKEKAGNGCGKLMFRFSFCSR